MAAHHKVNLGGSTSCQLQFDCDRATRRSLELGQVIALTLHLDSPDRGESVDACVVRVSERDDQFWNFEIGVLFIEPLSDELLGRVEAKANLG